MRKASVGSFREKLLSDGYESASQRSLICADITTKCQSKMNSLLLFSFVGSRTATPLMRGKGRLDFFGSHMRECVRYSHLHSVLGSGEAGEKPILSWMRREFMRCGFAYSYRSIGSGSTTSLVLDCEPQCLSPQ